MFQPQSSSYRRGVFALGLVIFALSACSERSVKKSDGGASLDNGGIVKKDGGGQDAFQPWEVGAPDRGKKLDKKVRLDKKVPRDSKVPPKDGPVKTPKDGSPKPCNTMGIPCLADKDCCSGMNCSKLFSGAKVCTKKCTPDDPSTKLVIEDTCPGYPNGFVCANIAAPPGVVQRCLKRCSPTTNKNTCPAGLACDPLTTVMTSTSDKAVCGWPACKSGKDCPVHLTKLCTPSSPAWQCQGMPKGVYCAPVFLSSFSGRCAYEGVCNSKSGLCTKHKRGKSTAKVADPCTDDRDCGGQMECMMEVSTSGIYYWANGYCSIRGCVFSSLTERQCPSGSTCSRNHYGGRCLKTCSLKQASSCRGYAKDKHGDYECRGWNNTSASAAPVCEGGFVVPCTTFSGSKATCSVLGDYGNTTDMACRNIKTGKKLSAKDPNGYCLDTTASGK